MRNAFKLAAATTLAALATMAFLASGALAQSLEVTKEPSPLHCPPVIINGTDVKGGCLTHATGEFEFRQHTFAIESHITNCRFETHERIDENGEGYYLEQRLLPHPGGCFLEPCGYPAEAIPWRFHDVEVPPGMTSTVSMCVQNPGGPPMPCEVDFPLSPYPGIHRWEVGTLSGEASSHGTTGFNCEASGHHISEIGGMHDGQWEEAIEYTHVP